MPSPFSEESNDTRLRLDRFSRLGTWYIFALSVIASVILIAQVLTQRHLKDQQNDSRVVNVAGKQRMLSQKISKLILLIKEEDSIDKRDEWIDDLSQSISLWKVSQQGLLNGNDSLQLSGNNTDEVVRLINDTNIPFNVIYSRSSEIISAFKKDPGSSVDFMKPMAHDILLNEGQFLKGMEAVVFQYDKEAREKIQRLSAMEYILLIVSLIVIALEILFIFRPTAGYVNKTINRLIGSEKNARKMAKEIRMLYSSLEKSYEQIAQINQPVENPRVYAKSDARGNVIFISSAFTELSGKEEITSSVRFCDLFDGLDRPNDWMDDWIDSVSEGKQWQGEITFRDRHHKTCWVELTIVPVYNSNNDMSEWVMMGSDITKRKSAEQNINLKNQAAIEQRINQQKFRSVLILEGQEEERKRIAMDIHDGIGQMLTSLKYHLESIDLRASENATRKLNEIDALIKQVIKEVRKVTFNLKPPVLGDYGLEAAINVFVKEIGKLIDTRLEFNTTGVIERLPQKIENNIFRIIQEAINNAIKYSGADAIEINLSQVDEEVVVQVKDKGKGFDTKRVDERSMNIESGRGLFNMYERTEYINGTLKIDSQPNKGTTVTLKVPVKSMVTTL